MKLKRSQQKRITKEAQIIRHMRISKELSLSEAASKVNISGSAIAHIEQGRMDLSRKRIETLVEAYGYTLNDYLEFLDGKEVPVNHRDECIHLLGQIDDIKLRAVHAVLTSFISQGK